MHYVGGKIRLAKLILPIILQGRKTEQYYVEPFGGGMNVISEVDGNRIAGDYHPELIAMWKALVNENWRPKRYYTRTEYNLIKFNRKYYRPETVGWVGFNCAFRGKYFAGFSGLRTRKDKNVVRKVNSQSETFNSVARQIPKLKGVEFYNCFYWEIPLPPKSIIYCDKPYENTTGYGTEFDHAKFWQWCRDRNAEGHRIFISEYNAPDDFVCLWEKEVSNSLGTREGKQSRATEKLFTLL